MFCCLSTLKPHSHQPVILMVFYISVWTGGFDQIILLEGHCVNVARPGKYGQIIISQV